MLFFKIRKIKSFGISCKIANIKRFSSVIIVSKILRYLSIAKKYDDDIKNNI